MRLQVWRARQVAGRQINRQWEWEKMFSKQREKRNNARTPADTKGFRGYPRFWLRGLRVIFHSDRGRILPTCLLCEELGLAMGVFCTHRKNGKSRSAFIKKTVERSRSHGTPCGSRDSSYRFFRDVAISYSIPFSNTFSQGYFSYHPFAHLPTSYHPIASIYTHGMTHQGVTRLTLRVFLKWLKIKNR